MYDLLVLGLIPGTNLQISFQAWLIMLASLPLITALYMVWHRNQYYAKLQAYRLRHFAGVKQLNLPA
ncbi:MAG TPA: hypothetical protein VLF79_02995 [Candidatus Saccharimonadales bacterium]|nr:hypothetical protein [Candidatus Saccharimonadales bacterium]